jgi:hypothetical protein
VTTTLPALTRVWRGELTWREAQAAGTLALRGATAARRDLPGWLGVSALAQALRSA